MNDPNDNIVQSTDEEEAVEMPKPPPAAAEVADEAEGPGKQQQQQQQQQQIQDDVEDDDKVYPNNKNEDDEVIMADIKKGTSSEKTPNKKATTPPASTSQHDTATNNINNNNNANTNNPAAVVWTDMQSRRLRILEHSPRWWAILVAIILPLWILIGISLLGGKLLAAQEGPNELQLNDNILANRYAAEIFDPRRFAQELLERLPEICLNEFLQEQTIELNYNSDSGTGNGMNGSITLAEFYVIPESELEEVLTGDSGQDMFGDGEDGTTTTIEFAYNYTVLDWALILSRTLNRLEGNMTECAERVANVLESVIGFRQEINLNLASESLTFNWIRCWNETLLGPIQNSRPTKGQIRASADQSPYYEAVWREDQAYLYDYYLNEMMIEDDDDQDDGERRINITDDDRLYALNRSIAEATGRSGCDVNGPGTAWFWFTVMTTVGYGNQAPETSSGRTMVALLGLVSILCFAGILANAGSIVNVIWEDFVRRFQYPFSRLRNPIVGCLIWGSITVGWLFFLGTQSRMFWRQRLDGAYPATKWDSIWFAFITTTTVGLGDFFYPPEVIFAEDVFRFSFIILVGFVFFATFLGQISNVFGSYFPDAGDKLKHRLENTQLLYETINQLLVDGQDGGGGSGLDAFQDAASVPLDRSTIDTLQKLLEEQQKKEQTQQEENEKPSQDLSILEDEEITLMELLKLKKAQQLRLLQEEEALLWKLMENNRNQQKDQQQQQHQNASSMANTNNIETEVKQEESGSVDLGGATGV